MEAGAFNRADMDEDVFSALVEFASAVDALSARVNFSRGGKT